MNKDPRQLQAALLKFPLVINCYCLCNLVTPTFRILEPRDLHEFPEPCKLRQHLPSLWEGMLKFKGNGYKIPLSTPTGDWTLGLTYARQVLTSLSYTPGALLRDPF